jgi:hypothetical protein
MKSIRQILKEKQDRKRFQKLVKIMEDFRKTTEKC